MLLPLFGLTGAFRHGAKQAYGVQVVLNAISEARLSMKEAAAVQELSDPQWSLQCANRDGAHVSFQRLMELPPKVLASIGRQLFLDFSGGGVCLEQPAVVEIVTTNQRVVERLRSVEEQLALALESRQQIRMEVVATAERRSA